MLIMQMHDHRNEADAMSSYEDIAPALTAGEFISGASFFIRANLLIKKLSYFNLDL